MERNEWNFLKQGHLKYLFRMPVYGGRILNVIALLKSKICVNLLLALSVKIQQTNKKYDFTRNKNLD